MTGPGAPRIVVVGPGRMGVGMALAFACAGLEVDLVDLKPRPDPLSSLRRAGAEFAAALDLLVEVGAIPGPRRGEIAAALRLHPLAEADAALAAADVVFEAVPEVAEAKREAFASICGAVGEGAILASTTSSFLVDFLAELVVGPERFLNTHWLNPAFLMPLVEVSPGERTSSECQDEMLALLRRAGKVPVTVAATPGYVVPRLQALVMNEAARMLEEGVASAEDLDTAARLGLGIRFSVLGPIEFVDWGGVDTLLYASRYLRQELDAERFEPPPVLADRVGEGATGMSAGRGLLDYEPGGLEELQKVRLGELVARLRHLELLPWGDS